MKYFMTNILIIQKSVNLLRVQINWLTFILVLNWFNWKEFTITTKRVFSLILLLTIKRWPIHVASLFLTHLKTTKKQQKTENNIIEVASEAYSGSWWKPLMEFLTQIINVSHYHFRKKVLSLTIDKVLNMPLGLIDMLQIQRGRCILM